MENNFKLYKCYKGTCSKCINEENPYLTEDEYKELLDSDGKVQCPEGHLDCGIQELKPEDYPKPPKDHRKILILGGGILIILLVLIGVVYLFSAKSKPETIVELPGVTGKTQLPETHQVDAPTPQSEAISTNAEKVVKEVAKKIEPAIEAAPISTTPTLEGYLLKIGDKSIPYGDKNKFKEEVISSYFENDDAQIIEIGKNNTEVSHTKVIDYMEELSQQYYRIKIIKQETNSQKKITKLYIKEL